MSVLNCFPSTKETAKPEVAYHEDGRVVLYRRRHFVLAAYSLATIARSVHASRATALIPEFAIYFDQPNEFRGFSELGIDFLSLSSSALELFVFPLAGMLTDWYGLSMLTLGAVLQALSAWWWFLAGTDYIQVVCARLLGSFAAALIGVSLLRISVNWYSEKSRTRALAIASIMSTFGAGAALLINPLFSTDGQKLNFNLKSCQLEPGHEALEGALEGEDCPLKAIQAFCCAAPTEIESLSQFIAIFTTIVAVFVFLVTRDSPPTPPSRGGMQKDGTSLKKALTIMFSKRNYAQLCLADFTASGPPLVLFATIDRIFPASVSKYSATQAAASIVVAVPTVFWFARKLSKTKKFYEYTLNGYLSGTTLWVFAAVCFGIDTTITDYFILLASGCALVAFVVWSVAVYELKMEYVFSPVYALEGFIVAIDRTVLNLASLIFLTAIPPERINSELIDGRLFTFLVGGLAMILGTLLVVTIKDKHGYLRARYERLSFTTSGAKNEDKSVESKPGPGERTEESNEKTEGLSRPRLSTGNVLNSL